MPETIHCVIMGGGRGTRLHPLTKMRCKPAVPLAGKYRLVDIPISNCLNSGYNNIYLLTQFNTASLHRHIQQSFRFDSFSGGFVEILSAEQTHLSDGWYQGTADAVRRNLCHFRPKEDDLFLILSGDQLYHMDFKKVIEHHRACGAEVTIAAKALPKKEMSSFGGIKVKDNYAITDFIEKPQTLAETKPLTLSARLKKKLGFSVKDKTDYCLASMGIYVFNTETLIEALNQEGSDFGKEIIPGLLSKNKLCAYPFTGYWEDIGTIRAFFEANLKLTDDIPPFNFFDAENPIYTHKRHLPASKLNSCIVKKTIIGDGCIISEANLKRCVIGNRSVIREGSVLENVVMMGADKFETLEQLEQNVKAGVPNIGIGRSCYINNAIIDKGARIGNDVILTPSKNIADYDGDYFMIRDGVVCIPKDAVIPDGTILEQ